MKKTFYVLVLLAGLLSLASCNDKEPNGGNNPANPQDGINFTIGQESPSSRTHYASNDWLQIEWDMNDLITIACAQTQAPTDDKKTSWTSKTSAVYKVNKLIPYPHDVFEGGTKIGTITTNSKAGITANSSSASDALYWGSGEHTFYAGYGENISINPSTGRATCQYKTEQTLTEVNGTWINMSHAYMVASTTTNPTESVNLIFQPIMTTLDIELNGMTSGAAGAKAIKVMSMEVTIEKDADVLYATGDDMYFDINFSPSDATDATERYKITTDPDKKAGKLNRTITFAFEPGKSPTVEVGGSLSITAILPRIDIGGTNGKPVTITISTEDGSNMFTFNDPVKSGYKAKILTKPWVKPEKFVDLGLSVKWATCNLGSTSPEECGDYYGWGCVEPYAQGDNVDWPVYFQKIGGTGSSANDCGTYKDPLADYVISPIGNIAGSGWDAARTKLGGKWRMPTRAELMELLDEKKCNWEWITNYNGTGCSGYLVTSTVPGYKGNSIFLPTTGFRTNSKIRGENYGYYWSSIPNSNKNPYMLMLNHENNPSFYIDNTNRKYGYTIRPVWDSSTDEIKAVDLGLPSGTKWANLNLGASKIEEYGDYYGWGCTEPYAKRESADWPIYFQKLGGTGTIWSDCGTDKDPLKDYVKPKSVSIEGTDWDAAKKKLGGNWRMPTDAEWQELINNCTFIWDTVNKGLVLKSTVNGNYIFLPAGGYKGSGTEIGLNGYYWRTMSVEPNNIVAGYDHATKFSFSSAGPMWSTGTDSYQVRYYGLLIRPVMK